MNDSTNLFTITAEDGVTQFTISDQGAICTSMKMPTRTGIQELIYSPHKIDNPLGRTIGGLCLSFPNCGQLQRNGQYGRYFFQDQMYELPKHGFAWHLPWERLYQEKDQIGFILKDNDLTRKQYPFEFIVELDFMAKPSVLHCRLTVTNRSNFAMPYYGGFNCYLQMPPAPASKREMIFYYEPSRYLKYDEDNLDVIGEDFSFKMPIAVTELPEDEFLTKLGENNQIYLHYPNNNRLYIEMEGVGINNMFPYIQLERDPELNYLGIQTWMSYPNALNSVQGVRWLSPRASEQGWVRFFYDTHS